MTTEPTICHAEHTDNGFAQGGDAYRAWSDKQCEGKMPENPHDACCPQYDDWETGFDDAMEYRLHGQYRDD